MVSLGDVTLYIDGEARGTRGFIASGTPLLFDSQHRVEIGSAGEWWGGGLDEVAVYDYALTPEQVAAHYLAGVNP